MTDTAAHLTAVESFIKDHPDIKYISPSSAEFGAAREVWNGSRRDHPLAIVQPQSPADVTTVIKFTKSSGIPFTLRSGGHNLEGLSVVQDALLIDLRAFNSVTVSEDRNSATVGGGILQGELVNELWEQGLATPTGTIPTVGYIGWASYGGYGPFSSHWGLGVDQIIGATVVNPDGDIIKADETILEGIRGAGGLFGVIIDLTIKVYPLTSILSGPIIFDSSDIVKSYTDFNRAYHSLLDTEGLPPQLTLQRVTFQSPRGLAFAALFCWSGTDLEEGKQWSEKIAALGPAKMNMVKPTTIPEWLGGAGAHVPNKVYGSSWSMNLSTITTAVAEAIARNLNILPNDPGAMFSLHQLRGPSAAPQEHGSVFGSREPHYMLEILAYGGTSEKQAESEAWGKQMADEVEKAAAESMLPTAYVSLYGSTHAGSTARWVDKVYGEKAGVLRDIKAKFDPENIFKLTVPLLE
ncbi:6-hydroxy-D-nicotine oxidase [Penicillium tannophilum]|nr:6-hydroxy-D-nicotine oxidase [Penicillium tannophilum]